MDDAALVYDPGTFLDGSPSATNVVVVLGVVITRFSKY